jgi:hypothetical protein
MTDDKLENISRALGCVLACILIMLAFIGWAFGQDVSTTGAQNTGNHTGNHEHKDHALIGLNNRVQAVEVLYLEPIENGHRLEWKASDRHRIVYETFTVTKAADVDAEVLRKPKGKFAWLVWCGDDRFVYALLMVRPEQIKKR